MDLPVAEFKLRQCEIGAGMLSEAISNPVSQKARRMPPHRRHRAIPLLVGVMALVYGAIVLLNPWAIHMGGRWTPLLTWTGTGKLVTVTGTYPLLVTFSPSAHSSRLRLDGLRPTSGA